MGYRGIFVFTEDEVELLLCVEKGELDKQNFINRCSSVCSTTENVLTSAASRVHLRFHTSAAGFASEIFTSRENEHYFIVV